MPRFTVIEVPAWTGIKDEQTGETLLTVHTKWTHDKHGNRLDNFLTKEEFAKRVAFVRDALEACYPSKEELSQVLNVGGVS